MLAAHARRANRSRRGHAATVDLSSWAYSGNGELDADNYEGVLQPHQIGDRARHRRLSERRLSESAASRTCSTMRPYKQQFSLHRNARSAGVSGGLSHSPEGCSDGRRHIERLVVELAAQVRERFYGKYRGIVDRRATIREELGRIKAQVPDVFGDIGVALGDCRAAPYRRRRRAASRDSACRRGCVDRVRGRRSVAPDLDRRLVGHSDRRRTDRDGSEASPLKILRSDTRPDGRARRRRQARSTLSDGNGSNFMTIKVNDGADQDSGDDQGGRRGAADRADRRRAASARVRRRAAQYLNQLVSIFNTHMHAGETVLGIPVTPMVPRRRSFRRPRRRCSQSKVTTG